MKHRHDFSNMENSVPTIREQNPENEIIEEKTSRQIEKTGHLKRLLDRITDMARKPGPAGRVMLPITSIMVVLTIIMHMTIGGGAALRPYEDQSAAAAFNNEKSGIAYPESQSYADSAFNRGTSEPIDISNESVAAATSQTSPASGPAVTAAAAETTQASVTEAESVDPDVSEPVVTQAAPTEPVVVETEPAPVFTAVDETMYVTANKVNLRSGPGTDAEIIDIMLLGQKIRRTGIGDQWSSVILASGLEGYVSSDFLSSQEPPKPTPTPTPVPTPVPTKAPVQTPVAISPDSKISPERQQEMVNLAKSFLGVRYQTPCNAPTTFDCSGFTRYIYLTMFGVELPYTTYGQITKGISVNKSLADIQIGDIICFDWSYDGSCDHVGLYIGDNQIIDASYSAGKVRQKALNIESSPILSIRRIIY